MDRRVASDYDRGRSGRPLMRLKAQLKREGSNHCWICGRAIDMELSRTDRNHRDAWTLDHYIPLSVDPTLALEYSNAREAHRRCNSARGNRIYKEPDNASRRW